MYACPICDREQPHPHERLKDAWRICALCGVAYRLADGRVVAWAPTNKSHPHWKPDWSDPIDVFTVTIEPDAPKKKPRGWWRDPLR